jgi:hypothetical protein
MALAEELWNEASYDQELYRMGYFSYFEATEPFSLTPFSLTKAGGGLDLSPGNQVLARQVDIQLGQW